MKSSLRRKKHKFYMLRNPVLNRNRRIIALHRVANLYLEERWLVELRNIRLEG